MWIKKLSASLLAVMVLSAACGATEDYSSADSAGSSEEFEQVSEAIAADSDESADFEMSDGGDDASAVPEAAPGTAPPEAPGAEPASFQDEDIVEEDPAVGAESEALAVVRTIIRRATIHLQVEDVLSASREAVILIESYGGFVFGQETSTEGESRSSLTFKVAPDDFQRVIEDLSGLGFLRDQTITADDVTGRVVDLQSQIQTSETSVERLRAFLAEAKDLETITSLENSLLDREAQLELLRGQLRTIQSQASLATITVVFTERVPGPELEVDVTAYFGHDDGGTCIGDDTVDLDEDDLATLCYRLSNTGDTYLSYFTLRDSPMKLDQEDFLEVKEGSLDKPLAPGDHLTLYVEIEADPDRAVVLGQIGATPTDELGNSLDIEGVAGRDELRMSISRDESLPTFSDGLTGSWNALKYLITVLVLLAGVALPFIWLIPILYFGRRWIRNRPKKDPRGPGGMVQPGAAVGPLHGGGQVANPAGSPSWDQPPAPVPSAQAGGAGVDTAPPAPPVTETVPPPAEAVPPAPPAAPGESTGSDTGPA